MRKKGKNLFPDLPRDAHASLLWVGRKRKHDRKMKHREGSITSEEDPEGDKLKKGGVNQPNALSRGTDARDRTNKEKTSYERKEQIFRGAKRHSTRRTGMGGRGWCTFEAVRGENHF